MESNNMPFLFIKNIKTCLNDMKRRNDLPDKRMKYSFPTSPKNSLSNENNLGILFYEMYYHNEREEFFS